MSYCELPSFYEETFPRAKKEHKCVECSAPIVEGEQHLSYRAHWHNIGFGAAAQLKMGKDKPHSLVEFSIDADGEAVKIRMDITAAKDEVTND